MLKERKEHVLLFHELWLPNSSNHGLQIMMLLKTWPNHLAIFLLFLQIKSIQVHLFLYSILRLTINFKFIYNCLGGPSPTTEDCSVRKCQNKLLVVHVPTKGMKHHLLFLNWYWRASLFPYWCFKLKLLQ